DQLRRPDRLRHRRLPEVGAAPAAHVAAPGHRAVGTHRGGGLTAAVPPIRHGPTRLGLRTSRRSCRRRAGARHDSSVLRLASATGYPRVEIPWVSGGGDDRGNDTAAAAEPALAHAVCDVLAV